MKKMRVAIIGQGRSGRDIHGKYFLSKENDNVEVVYVVDEIKERREKGEKTFGCKSLASYKDLFGKNDEIDVVVNASFSQYHYSITKDLLNHGFNVLVEKPFSRTYKECKDLIKTAKKNGVTVVAFHQTLFGESYLNAKKFIESGKLGDIFQISLKYSGYARRWDWQTLQKCVGGSVYNSGPHPVGQALELLGWENKPKVEFSDMRTVITSGDAEDYGKIILSCKGRPNVDLEICSVDAFANDYVYKIFGSKGTLVSTHAHYKAKYVKLEELEPKPVIEETLHDKDWNPQFCGENLPFIEEEGDLGDLGFEGAVKKFYDMLYDTIMNGKPLAVTPEMGAEVIRVIETAHKIAGL